PARRRRKACPRPMSEKTMAAKSEKFVTSFRSRREDSSDYLFAEGLRTPRHCSRTPRILSPDLWDVDFACGWKCTRTADSAYFLAACPARNACARLSATVRAVR